ncbi:MAG: MATE family efflux transporter [Clostridia bacterium]|nr:MATE family efflux transporter [Clostridia bacterium]
MTKDKTFYKQFFSLYWVLVLHNIIVFGVNLADNIMIGSYSETALAGVAAVNQIQFIFQQIIMGCGEGLVVLGSQYWGQGRTDEIKRISFGAMIIGVIAGSLLFVSAAAVPERIISIFSPTPDIITQGAEYLRIIKYTYIVFAITNILLATLRTVETVKIGFYISVSTLIINCSINYLLIHGNFGFPELGVTGAAIGTLTARVVELIAVICYIAFGDKKLRISLKEYFRFDKGIFKDYFRIGRTIVIVNGMFGVSTALQSVILGHMSDSAIAANSVSTSLYQMLKVAAVGAASATSVIIGKTIGTGDMKKLKDYTKTFQLMFVMIGAVIAVALFILRAPVLSMYNLTPETMELANMFLLIMCAAGFGMSYQMPVLCGIVRGGGDPGFVLKNDFISIWLIVLPISFLAAFKFNLHPAIVVFCLNADQIFKCGAAFFKVNSYTWVKKLTK